MPVDALPRDHFASDKALAYRSARAKLDFVMQNIAWLKRVDNAQHRAENAARNFLMLLKNGEDLTPGQLAYCDGLYEQTMRGAGYEGLKVHSDRKQRSLKFG